MTTPEKITGQAIDESPIAANLPANQRALVLGALNVLNQCKKFDLVLQSPSDSLDVMPDQDQYIAGDTRVTITPLYSTRSAMLELQVEPLASKKAYKTIVSIAFENSGITLHRDSNNIVTTTDSDMNESDLPISIKGSNAAKMQQIILNRTARNLFVKSQEKTKTP